MQFRRILMAATFVVAPAFLPGAAHAQRVTGPYLSAGLGYNIMGGRDLKEFGYGVPIPTAPSQPIFDPSTLPPGASGQVLFHPGFAGAVALGYGFGNGFRVELEGDYFNNRADKMDAQAPGYSPGQVNVSGTEQKYGVMVNGLYDFDVGSKYIYPFLGAGIGYQFVNWQDIRAPASQNPLPLEPMDFSQTKGAFAYQLIAGVSLPIQGVPGLSATLQYRYLSTLGNQTFTGYAPNQPLPVAEALKVGKDTNNTILVGLRYQLFQPAPPAPAPAPAPTPVAAPAPAPARTYLVFFDWDKANLTPRAKQIVGEAAHASITTNVTRLNVNGYTDTSGPAGYNMKLSLRRANNVAAELVADGVDKKDIVIKGFGETHLLVPTGPNVREPQNRRVEIILH